MKNPILVVSLVLLLCFVFGCQNKAEKAELEKFRAQAKLEEQNKAFMRKVGEEMNKGNIEILSEANGPNYAYYFPSANPKSISSDELIGLIKTLKAGIPDLIWNIGEQVAEGDIVVSRGIMKGTHTATFQGIPATGKEFELSVINWVRIKDGRIVEEREDADIAGLMQQLGFELKPMEVKK